jgi:chromosomal replication initiation ATPase DnaA
VNGGAEQLPLPFAETQTYIAADFIESPSNAAALKWLARDEWPDHRLAIWGPDGCGKTHLLHLWAGRLGAALLTGSELRDFMSLPQSGGVAIDDADRIRDEELLLHLLNVARDRNLRVLIAARSAPARWPVILPDLSSRLRAINAVEVAGPEDDLLHLLLVRALSQRQLDVGGTVQAWLLHHLPRTAGGVLEAVKRLDAESLLQGKPITRAFAARILGSAMDDEVSMSVSRPDHQPSPEGSDGL